MLHSSLRKSRCYPVINCVSFCMIPCHGLCRQLALWSWSRSPLWVKQMCTLPLKWDFWVRTLICSCPSCIWRSADLHTSSRECVTVWLLDIYIKMWVNLFEIFQFSCEPLVCSYWLAGQSLLCFFSLPCWNLLAFPLNTEEILIICFLSERIILLWHI